MQLTKLFGTMMIASIVGLGDASANTPLKAGIDFNNLDRTVSPADDFYSFAVGGWQKANPLPAAYSRYSSFDQLQDENNKRLNGILAELQTGTFTPGTTKWKLSVLYKAAMDSTRRTADGAKPAMKIIAKLEAAKGKKELLQIQYDLAPLGDQPFYTTYFDADEMNAKYNALHVRQGGLTLEQKEYYLDNDTATVSIREAYKMHIVRMFKLFGFSEKEATKKMKNIMKLETALAKASRTKAELRDPNKNYNKMTLKEFEEKYPSIGLEAQMNATGVKSEFMQTIIVGQPEFMAEADKVIAGMTADEYRDYMEWGQINAAADFLSDEIAEANFDFLGRTMTGAKEMHPLWKRATKQIEGKMGQALGKMYVERYFPASSKERMEKLVSNLQKALGKRIMAQEWMGDSTKQAAMEKLASFYVKIGYPKEWIDMTALTMDPALSYYENIEACRRFWTKWTIDEHAGKPVNREEWYMYPQTVNAYYNPATNEICFPAGILQPPFFDAEADDAFNYGAIGVVIGHEMTHGFDDEGRNFDKDGNMRGWWTEADAKSFVERTDRYADFFSSIKVLPDLNGNGRLTLGENLADHGGLQVAFYAYKEATKDNQLPVIEGTTGDQRFFLAYAGVWADNITEAEIRKRTKSDPHSLGRWRVNGALPHIDMWYDAFGIKKGDGKMFLPEDQRLKLW